MARKPAAAKKQTTELTVAQLKTLTPHGNAAILENTVKFFNEFAEEFGFTTPLRKSHFLAQIAHESGHFQTTVEYGRGKGRRYAPWYGRGLIQLTWQENYAAFYEWCIERGLKSVPEFFTNKDREKAADFPWAFLSAIWYWDSRNLNRWADEDNVRKVTKLINGGYNGLDDRIKYLNAAKKIFGVSIKDVDTDAGTITEKFTVRDVQEALVKHNITVTVDGKMGEKTITAVKLFQKMNKLVPDGIIGPKTSAKLFAKK